MNFYRLLFFLLFFAGLRQFAIGQQNDSLKAVKDSVIKKHISREEDSIIIRNKKRKHIPQIATRRSAILPGWGQIYNRSYWKLPLVYGALGITAYIFVDNLGTVKATNYAIRYLTPTDSAGTSYDNIAPYLRPFVDAEDVNSLRNVRNQFRQYVDYSALVFILFWGLNVLDATVDAHLKHFDVSDELSLKIKPNIIPSSSQVVGVSLVFDIHKGKPALRALP